MNVRIYLKEQDVQRFTAYAQNLPGSVKRLLMEKAAYLGEKLRRYVISSKLSGQVLNKRSGRLQRSLRVKVTSAAHKVVGTIVTNSSYGRLFEKGGRIPAHIIRPDQAKALMWIKDGGKHFAKEVFHPGYQVKAKRYLANSLREMSVEISREMKLAVLEAVRNK